MRTPPGSAPARRAQGGARVLLCRARPGLSLSPWERLCASRISLFSLGLGDLSANCICRAYLGCPGPGGRKTIVGRREGIG